MKLLLSLLISLACIVVNANDARCAEALKPTSSFEVGNTHVDKYIAASASGSALILVPGLTDSAAVWTNTIARFAPTHTIYALTLAGFGGRAADQAPMIDKADADIATLIMQEHLVKPVIIGHSLGGHIVIRVAEEHSALLGGAVAVDGLPVFPGFDAMTPELRKSTAAQMAAPMANLPQDKFEAFDKAQIIPYMTQAKNVDAVAAAGKGASPAASAEYMQELLSADIRPALANITVPLLELAPFDATLDPYNPQSPFKTLAEKQASYQRLLSGDKTAKVEMIDNSRHFIMYDQPDAFYAAVDMFLKSLP